MFKHLLRESDRADFLAECPKGLYDVIEKPLRLTKTIAVGNVAPDADNPYEVKVMVGQGTNIVNTTQDPPLDKGLKLPADAKFMIYAAGVTCRLNALADATADPPEKSIMQADLDKTVLTLTQSQRVFFELYGPQFMDYGPSNQPQHILDAATPTKWGSIVGAPRQIHALEVPRKLGGGDSFSLSLFHARTAAWPIAFDLVFWFPALIATRIGGK